MPPEAIQAPDAVDARGDLYQIGAIGYFLLEGHHVFRGDRLFEVLDQHLHATPEPLGDDVPGELARWIQRCLAKSPDDRPADADEIAAALAALALEHPWSQEAAAAWWREWRRAHPRSEAADPGSGPMPPGAEVDIMDHLGHAPPPP
jgi:serine/threonine-protein kinase